VIRRPAHETIVKIKSWIKRLPVDVGCSAVGRRNGRDKASLLLGECDVALFVHWYLFIRRHNNGRSKTIRQGI
jgi:hypothetical protein